LICYKKTGSLTAKIFFSRNNKIYEVSAAAENAKEDSKLIEQILDTFRLE